jgi:hypothetical protein
MLTPEIEAREAAKTLDLLRYALVRERVDPRRYAVAADPAALGPGDDQFCLTQGDDGWDIFYVERGQRTDIARFAGVRDAARHLFMALTDPTSFYGHRPAWESETGQEFSMIA